MAGHDASGSVDAREAVHGHGAALELRPDGLLDRVVRVVHAAAAEAVPLVHRLANQRRLGVPVRVLRLDKHNSRHSSRAKTKN